MSRDEFLEAARASYTTEFGSYGTKVGDEKAFGKFIRSNWRTLVMEVDSLMKNRADGTHGFTYSTLALACEDLQGQEYVALLDSLALVLEKKKAAGEPLSNYGQLFSGFGAKKNFLSVNYEHPSVRPLLRRLINLFEDVPPDGASVFKAQMNGELADNYLIDSAPGSPLPETLPGIKLKRPFGSLIKRYEQLTGKKVPPDPNFPEEQQTRPSKRNPSTSVGPERTFADAGQKGGVPWALVAAVAAGLAALMAVGKCMFKQRR